MNFIVHLYLVQYQFNASFKAFNSCAESPKSNSSYFVVNTCICFIPLRIVGKLLKTSLAISVSLFDVHTFYQYPLSLAY